eukprot:698046-Alexandrium_andersonii.AAC.1
MQGSAASSGPEATEAHLGHLAVPPLQFAPTAPPQPAVEQAPAQNEPPAASSGARSLREHPTAGGESSASEQVVYTGAILEESVVPSGPS